MENKVEKLEEKGKNILDETMDEYESRPRTLSQRKELVIGILAVTFSLFQLYTSWAGPFVDLVQRSIHIAFAFSLLFATFPPKKKSKKRDQILWIDWILIGASLVCSLWVTYSAERMVENPGDSIPIDLVLGIIMVFIVLEGARRVIGPVLPGISLFIILYAWLIPYLPGSWASRGFSLRSIIENLYVSTIGIWGMVTGISASVIAGFLIFGVMLQKLRGGRPSWTWPCESREDLTAGRQKSPVSHRPFLALYQGAL